MKPLFIKICGLRDKASIDVAIDAGADAVGFVLAASPRQVSASTAAELKAYVNGRVKVIAVMRHPSVAEWQAVISELTPDYLQTDAGDFSALNLPDDLGRIPVYRDGGIEPDESLPLCLYESVNSGSGESADWQRARDIASRQALILAGGLSPDNVADAIASVKPAGVDVSSGVESAPGVKDPARILDFIRRARRAENIQLR